MAIILIPSAVAGAAVKVRVVTWSVVVSPHQFYITISPVIIYICIWDSVAVAPAAMISVVVDFWVMPSAIINFVIAYRPHPLSVYIHNMNSGETKTVTT